MWAERVKRADGPFPRWQGGGRDKSAQQKAPKREGGRHVFWEATTRGATGATTRGATTRGATTSGIGGWKTDPNIFISSGGLTTREKIIKMRSNS